MILLVAGNKNDARAIWTAAQQPGFRTVAIKSEEQQAKLAIHSMRQQLVKFRTGNHGTGALDDPVRSLRFTIQHPYRWCLS